MPTLHWIGKEKVVNHHLDVPYRPLLRQYGFTSSASSDNTVGNRIVHGDNLEALKSLLPEFEGRVNCIYIDPPYNTGNEGWVYNDNLTDPRVRNWLGKVVGKEAEDLTRHDKWLCMIYPRLRLLCRLLASDGVFLTSIDENEYHGFKLVLDEVFGRNCYLGTIAWKTRNTDNRVKTRLSIDHELVVVYAKTSIHGRVIDRSDFTKWDEGKQDYYVTDPLTGKATAAERRNLHYPIYNAHAGDVYDPDPSRGWITDEAGFAKLLAENRIEWPPDPKTGKPRKKRYLRETSERMPVSSFWANTRGQTGADELDRMLGERLFAFPKSVDFMCRLLDVACPKDALILDSFAGSGTTAHAVLKLNQEDGGTRRFVLVEMMDYAETITAERLRRVMDGYGNGTESVPGLGGSFDFYTVSNSPMFDEGGNIDPATDIAEIRRYIAYTEGLPPEALVMADNPVATSFLGQYDGRGVVFHYAPETATTLDYDLLAALAFDPACRPRSLTVYADYCILSDTALWDARVTFKKIPRDLTRL